MAVLIALDIVLTGPLAISTQFLRVSFSFVTHSIIGVLFGPIGAGASMFVADVVRANIFPAGPFFIGFSLSAIVVGVMYGLFYYKKEITWQRVTFATIVITLTDSLFLTPIWLSIMYDVPFWSLMPVRFGKALIMIPIQIMISHFILTRLTGLSEFKKFQMMK